MTPFLFLSPLLAGVTTCPAAWRGHVAPRLQPVRAAVEDSAEPAPHRAGFVSIIGMPNVGKSTLMNRLVGERLAIMTPKAGTTRHRILGILNGDDYQLIYSDTPGIYSEPQYKLQEGMMAAARASLSRSAPSLSTATPPPASFPAGARLTQRRRPGAARAGRLPAGLGGRGHPQAGGGTGVPAHRPAQQGVAATATATRPTRPPHSPRRAARYLSVGAARRLPHPARSTCCATARRCRKRRSAGSAQSRSCSTAGSSASRRRRRSPSPEPSRPARPAHRPLLCRRACFR